MFFKIFQNGARHAFGESGIDDFVPGARSVPGSKKDSAYLAEPFLPLMSL